MTKERKNAREKIRFTPEGDQLGFISFNLMEFKPDISTLILNESSRGACLVVNRKLIPPRLSFTPGLTLLVKIGNLHPVIAIVRWVQEVDEDLAKVGIEHQG
jgi:hypothetical protein